MFISEHYILKENRGETWGRERAMNNSFRENREPSVRGGIVRGVNEGGP